MRFAGVLGIALLSLPFCAAASQDSDLANAGLVTGLWYSQPVFFDGDEIRIYSALQNQSGFDIKGVVKFFNSSELIEQKDFSIINGRLIEVWADWRAVEGDHEIVVEVASARRSFPGREDEEIILNQSAELARSKIFVDKDTDGDGIGNAIDEDDDNDGVSDLAEQEQGTNPNFADTSESGPQAFKTTKEISESIIESAKNVSRDIAGKLESIKEEHKKVSGSSVSSEETEEIKNNPWQKFYASALITGVFIFERWWLALIVFLILARQIWRIFRWFSKKNN